MRCLPKSVVSYFWGCHVKFPRCFPFCSKGCALLVSILCSLCLLVGLGVKNSHLKLICFVCVSSVLFVPPMHLLVKRGFILFGVAVSIFPGAFHSFQKGLPCLCPFCAFVSSCGPSCEKYHLKLICFVSVALVVYILCSLCLLVGLGVKKF